MFRPLVFALLLASGTASAATPCQPGQSEMSVEGVNGVFCVSSSPICIADISNGACPGAQNGLPFGSYCGVVATGVYGCKTLDANSSAGPAPTMATMSVDDNATTAPPATAAPSTSPVPVSAPVSMATDGSQCAGGQYEMSVEGVQGIFCLSEGPICMADLKTGTCPGPQNGLPNGSYCGIVASGVYGCKVGSSVGGSTSSPTTGSVNPTPATSTTPAATTTAPSATASTAPSAPTTTPVPASFPVPVATDGTQCGNGEYEMSVEGVRGVFCLKDGPICVADVKTGTCPGPQFGLPNGSYCGLVAPGVYGCKVIATSAPSVSATTVPVPATTTTAPAPATTTTTPAPATTTVAPAPATTTTAPAPATTTVAPAPVPATTTLAPTPASVPSSNTCANGGTPMSVEGIVPIFCVPEPACVAQRALGNCPTSQPGLPWGSYCDIITRTGQYGCKPYKGADVRSDTVYPPVRNCTGNAKGNMPVSVAGAQGEYCASHPVCAGTQFGNCPVAQDDLAQDSKCVAIRAGVFGCVKQSA